MALILVTLGDPQLPQTTQFSTFSIAFHIFLAGIDVETSKVKVTRWFKYVVAKTSIRRRWGVEVHLLVFTDASKSP